MLAPLEFPSASLMRRKSPATRRRLVHRPSQQRVPELESARDVGMTDHVAAEEDVDGLDGSAISEVRRVLGEVSFEGITGNGRAPQELTGRGIECFELFGQ